MSKEITWKSGFVGKIYSVTRFQCEMLISVEFSAFGLHMHGWLTGHGLLTDIIN